eukprot:892229-Rhodomonas_salina.3
MLLSTQWCSNGTGVRAQSLGVRSRVSGLQDQGFGLRVKELRSREVRPAIPSRATGWAGSRANAFAYTAQKHSNHLTDCPETASFVAKSAERTRPPAPHSHRLREQRCRCTTHCTLKARVITTRVASSEPRAEANEEAGEKTTTG